MASSTPKPAKVFPTVDIVLIVDGHSVVLIRRKDPPFLDFLVFPGGHIDEGERCAQACARECEEETTYRPNPAELDLLMVLDDPTRDPRPGHTLSLVYTNHITSEVAATLKPESDAKEIVIRPIWDIQPEKMGFDHYAIIDELRRKRLSL